MPKAESKSESSLQLSPQKAKTRLRAETLLLALDHITPIIQAMIADALRVQEIESIDLKKPAHTKELKSLKVCDEKHRELIKDFMSKLGKNLRENKLTSDKTTPTSFGSLRGVFTDQDIRIAASELNAELHKIRAYLIRAVVKISKSTASHDIQDGLEARLLNKYFVICSVLCLHSSMPGICVVPDEYGKEHRALMAVANKPRFAKQLLPELRTVISTEMESEQRAAQAIAWKTQGCVKKLSVLANGNNDKTTSAISPGGSRLVAPRWIDVSTQAGSSVLGLAFTDEGMTLDTGDARHTTRTVSVKSGHG